MRFMLALACIGVWLAGCSERARAPLGACGEQGCSAACAELRGDNCDILDEACRERIFGAVVCVRGTPGELPEVRTLTEDAYRDQLLAEQDEDAGTEERAADDAWSTGLGLVGLIDPEESAESASLEDRVANVAGFYDADTRAITLIDRGDREDDDGAQALLAHELVHALQDQEMGLYQLHSRTGASTDSQIARSCLVEGEAMLYEELAVSLLRGLPVQPGYWDVDLAWSLKHGQNEIARTRSPYAALWRLTYSVGARFMTDAWLRGGNRAVQGLYWAVPQSSIYWMHGYAAVERREGQLVRPLACNTAAAPSGYETVWNASLGPFAAYGFLAQPERPEQIARTAAAWDAALQWRQDSFTVLVNGEGAVAVSWRILFEAREAAELAATAASSRGARALVRGAELEVLAAEAEAMLEDWEGTDPTDCPVAEP